MKGAETTKGWSAKRASARASGMMNRSGPRIACAQNASAHFVGTRLLIGAEPAVVAGGADGGEDRGEVDLAKIAEQQIPLLRRTRRHRKRQPHLGSPPSRSITPSG